MRPYVYLGLAICSEVAGTLALRSSRGFTRLVPSVFVIVAYAFAFFLLSLTLRSMTVGMAYAIWSGVGTALVAVAGIVLFHEHLTLLGWVGIVLIVVGVFVLNLSAAPSQ